MNAQKAIEKVIDYKQTVEHIPYDVDKALSIVLESARMFHEDIIEDVSPVYRGHIYLYDVNNQILTTLDVEEAKSIGIVEGVDE